MTRVYPTMDINEKDREHYKKLLNIDDKELDRRLKNKLIVHEI